MNADRRPILPADAAGRIGRASRLLDPARAASPPDVRAPDDTAVEQRPGAAAVGAAEYGDTPRTCGRNADAGAPDPRRKAIELLARREHSQRELVRKLTDRGFSADAACEAVELLVREGWQDDQRYAAALARHRAQGGYGPLRIRAELRTHGLDEALIATALDACGMDWGRAAQAQLQKRFGTRRATTRQSLARQGAFLQRRGFELDDVRRALAHAAEDD
ncbi:MAG: regulatory protein RecX [Xanthomonadaceae bacterium]|nr:regulatory protein RecX [Xanthomonadaceae bacterium]